MTATPTPIVIVTKEDTTVPQFQALVSSLPKTAEPMSFTTNTEGHFWLIATLNQCDSEALWDNPHVEGMAIDNYIVLNDDVGPVTKLPTDADTAFSRKRSNDESQQVDKFQHEEAVLTFNSTNSKIVSRDLSDTSHIVEQTNGPDNLNWISALCRQGNLEGPFYNFENFMYDDGANRPTVPQSWVYYVDGDGFAIHSVRLQVPLIIHAIVPLFEIIY